MYYNINNLERLTAVKAKIKSENRSEKQEESDSYHNVERIFKPVIEPMKQLANINNSERLNIEEPLNIPAIQHYPNIPAIQHYPNIPAIQHYPNIPAIERRSPELLNLGILADKYLKKLNLKDYDHAYGIKPIEGSSKFRLGRMDVTIDGNDITIDDKRYKGTEDLWKLLTLKNPGEISDNEYERYKEIVLQTKPFLMDQSDRVKCNRGLKYKKFIKPIADQWKTTPNTSPCVSQYSTPYASPLRTDSGKRQRLESITGNGIVIIPSDPNDLVNKHRILFGSYQAGNTGVFNELNAVNDKLLQLGIFDTIMIQKLSSILNGNSKYQPNQKQF